ncbi:hypothetical protein FDP41_004462 [Naegleria fowleri]|uniref:Transmembrane protein n=1 Tax=Naegleria fowleri TaxID=5763 RepID=A0A6A5BFE5_NAEFO|nr:uncharacterized protein FDP41_004462 [Naegleria fowleri]KAF0976563.1 hypothetical protein FDP41_004462 [Naegleria fowleri]CAG4712626.1 unnamed protein product [Naegleria fowleri]
MNTTNNSRTSLWHVSSSSSNGIRSFSTKSGNCSSNSSNERKQSEEENSRNSSPSSWILNRIRGSFPTNRELFQMFITIIALISGTLFFTSDYFLNLLVQSSMRLLEWDKYLSYESISGCFFCGSMKIHNLSVKDFQVTPHHVVNGKVENLYIVIPWYLIAKECVIKYFKPNRPTYLYIPRFVAIGGDIHFKNHEEQNDINVLPQNLGFDTLVMEGIGVFDMNINMNDSADHVFVDRFEVFHTLSFHKSGSTNFYPFAVFSKGKFTVNQDNIIHVNIYHDDTSKSFENSGSDDYWTWRHENTPQLCSQWTITNSDNSFVVLCKYHDKSIQIQTHLNNDDTIVHSLSIPHQHFTFHKSYQFISPYLKRNNNNTKTFFTAASN